MTVLTCRRVFFLLAMVLPGLTSLAGEAGRPPNIVWLTVEDMSLWIGPYGDRTVPTPHLDRIAREGVVYENAFATSPVCAPARSSLITGMFCTRIGTMHMRNTGGSPPRGAITAGATPMRTPTGSTRSATAVAASPMAASAIPAISCPSYRT